MTGKWRWAYENHSFVTAAVIKRVEEMWTVKLTEVNEKRSEFDTFLSSGVYSTLKLGAT